MIDNLVYRAIAFEGAELTGLVEKLNKFFTEHKGLEIVSTMYSCPKEDSEGRSLGYYGCFIIYREEIKG